MKNLGLYIHIPFCIKKCNYCDFYSVACTDNDITERYINALCKHMEYESNLYKNYEFDTIFIGGGTPSVLSPKQFEKLSSAIKKYLKVSNKAEFSVESNPCSMTEEKLKTFLACGVNRLSIGMQSIDPKSLKILGRLHSFDEFREKYTLARELGFENINIDLMYATPGQTLESLNRTVDTVCALNPEHISAYCLKIEPNTPFCGAKLNLPSEDEQYDMYMTLCDKFSKHGYSHYEISNFAKKGHECKHNLKYWKMEEYIGFGPASHSFFDDVRYFYESDIQKYINIINNEEIPEKIIEEKCALIDNSTKDEYIMLKMRLSEGLSEKDFFNIFSQSIKEYLPQIEKYIKSGHIIYKNGIYSFSDKGFFVSNYILSDILKLN